MLALVLVTASASAHARWHTATSKHFVVYTEGTTDSARDAAARLEKFQIALRFLAGATAPSSPVKVKVFLVSGPDAVSATLPFGGGGVAGYYSATLRGPFTIMSRTTIRGVRGSRGERVIADQKAQQVLFHELTHHFVHQYFPAAYPVWYSEGFAEFSGSMQFEPNDVVLVGRSVEERYSSFLGNDWLSIKSILTAKNYADVRNDLHLLYAEGWLLVHYLTVGGNRPGQLKAYLAKVNQGLPFDRAAKEAFGDLDKLNGELRSYAGRGKLNALALPFKKLDEGVIEARALSPAEEDLLPFDMSLYAGIPARQASQFADKVVAAAARHANDAYALSLVYEAQQLAGRTEHAADAAKRWLALAPESGQAIAAQADALSDKLAAAKVADASRWQEVRQLYARAVKLAPNEPNILHAFYSSYVRQGVLPPAAAQNALYTALELLPQYDDLSLQVAADFERRNMIDEAISVIRRSAFEATNPADLSDREKQRRDADKAKYRLAGEQIRENAREMLIRLEEERAKTAK